MMTNCPHWMVGYSPIRVLWLLGTTYLMCRMCGQDVRGGRAIINREALSKMN